MTDKASFKTRFWWLTRNILLPLSGVFLLYITFKGKDYSNIWEAIISANIIWFILPRVLILLSYWFRAWRWVIQIRTFGHKTPVFTVFNAILATYMINIYLPQIGDFYRSWALNKTEKIPISRSFGTIVIEKIIDLSVLFVFLIVGSLLKWKEVSEFISNVIWENLKTKISLFYPFSFTHALILVAIIFALLFFLFGKFSFKPKLKEIFSNVWQGFISIKNIDNKTAFISLSFLIFFIYWLNFHLCLFAMADTAKLGFSDSLFVFTSSAFSQLAPIQAGIGAFHWMVTKSLSILSVNPEIAIAWATAVHATGIIFRVLCGIFGIAYLKRQGVNMDEITKESKRT